jgi:hypothetical protein
VNPIMIGRLRAFCLGGLLATVLATPAMAQDGFALKAGYIYNRAQVEGATEIPGASGFGAGIEYVLPIGIGVGVSGYSAGRTSEFDVESSSVNVAAEVNYFLKLPLLPLAPYAGVHAGFGRYSRRDDSRPGTRPNDSWGELGYQLGVRAQLLPILGLDVQFRRMSTSLENAQGSSLSREQVMVGVAIF